MESRSSTSFSQARLLGNVSERLPKRAVASTFLIIYLQSCHTWAQENVRVHIGIYAGFGRGRTPASSQLLGSWAMVCPLSLLRPCLGGWETFRGTELSQYS